MRLFFIAALFLYGCNFYESLDGGGTDIPPDREKGEKMTYSWLRKNVLSHRCFRCHAGDHPKDDLDLSKLSSTSGKVKAGDPKGSVLFQKVDAGEMPPDEPLSEKEKQWIADWIEDGALP